LSSADHSSEDAPAALSRTRQRRHGLLLDVGAAALLRDGYHATTMERIAEAARVSKATLYKYFPDKQELFLAAVASGRIGPNAELVRGTLATLERILSALTRASDAAEVTQAVQQLLELAAAGRADPFPRLMDELAFDQPALLARARALIMARQSAHFYAPFELALESRLPDGLDTEVLVHIFYALIAGYQLLDAAAASNPGLTRERWASGIAALLRGSLRDV
jgi:AcrR family transcriptional regulator